MRDALRKFAESTLPRPIEPTLIMTSDGLVLGSAVLAKMGCRPAGKPELLLDGEEQRILALLAVVYGEAIGPPILETIRRASDYWTRGEPVLAAIALARAGLPPLDDPERVSRGLSAAEQLLDNGCSPSELIKRAASMRRCSICEKQATTQTSRACPPGTRTVANGPMTAWPGTFVTARQRLARQPPR